MHHHTQCPHNSLVTCVVCHTQHTTHTCLCCVSHTQLHNNLGVLCVTHNTCIHSRSQMMVMMMMGDDDTCFLYCMYSPHPTQMTSTACNYTGFIPFTRHLHPANIINHSPGTTCIINQLCIHSLGFTALIKNTTS